MGSCSIARKKFQRAHTWEKFNHSGKIYCGEGTHHALRDVEGRQALAATALEISENPPCIFSFFGMCRLSFELFKLRPGFSQLCNGLVNNPLLSSKEVHFLMRSHPFPWAGFTPVCCYLGSSCACSEVGLLQFTSPLVSTVHAPHKGILPTPALVIHGVVPCGLCCRVVLPAHLVTALVLNSFCGNAAGPGKPGTLIAS